MSLGVLFSVFDDCLKQSRVVGHNGWLESDIDVAMVMGRDFDLLRVQLERKLVNRVGSLLPDIQFDNTRDLVRILYL